MPSDIIQWFPGHMAKTRRLITENLPQVDLVIEVLDARIPYSSKNPELRRLVGRKPVLTILSKSSLADPEAGRIWMEYYKACGRRAVFTDCVTGFGMDRLAQAVEELILKILTSKKVLGVMQELIRIHQAKKSEEAEEVTDAPTDAE